MSITYKAAARTVARSGLSGTVYDQKVVFDVTSENGWYGTVGSQEDANILVFGLNNNFLQSQFGGFAENVIEEIKKTMHGATPVDWAIVMPLSADDAAREAEENDSDASCR